jgi:MFS family permease
MVEEGSAGPSSDGGSLRGILGLRDFRLFWSGEAVSLVGDQFYLIALPWLVLTLSGNGVALGTALALAAFPRAILILVGGAVTDRMSPRSVMMLSNASRLAVVSVLAAVVGTGTVSMWMVYLLSFLFGVGDAFYYPAQMTIVPSLVRRLHLKVANSLVMGTSMIASFVGPVLAGITIASFMGGGSGLTGIAYALAIDAASFLASIATLVSMHPQGHREPDGEGIMSSLRQGFGYVGGDRALVSLALIVVVINLLLVGPVIVGIPLISKVRLSGASSYGVAMTAFGGGALLGILLAGGLPRPRGNLGIRLLALVSLMGVSLALLTVLGSTAAVALACLAIGVSNGYCNVMLVTWLQTRTAEAMMGRVMAIVMFASVGVSPVSMQIAGMLLSWQPALTFAAMGGALCAFALVMSMVPEVRRLGFEIGAGRVTHPMVETS